MSTTTQTPTVAVTVADFDSSEPFRMVRHHAPIGGFTRLVRSEYVPRGSTPLRDATAKLIEHLDGFQAPGTVTIGMLLDRSGSMAGQEEAVVAGVNEFVAGMADVEQVDADAGGKVLAVIFTDGFENASTEMSVEALQAMTADREAKGWTFIYLGANQDAWAEGTSQLGVSGGVTGQTVSYRATPKGTAAAMASITSDAQSFLGDNKQYSALRSSTSNRILSEDGEESLAPQAGDEVGPEPAKSYGDVGEALRRAKGES